MSDEWFCERVRDLGAEAGLTEVLEVEVEGESEDGEGTVGVGTVEAVEPVETARGFCRWICLERAAAIAAGSSSTHSRPWSAQVWHGLFPSHLVYGTFKLSERGGEYGKLLTSIELSYTLRIRQDIGWSDPS